MHRGGIDEEWYINLMKEKAELVLKIHALESNALYRKLYKINLILKKGVWGEREKIGRVIKNYIYKIKLKQKIKHFKKHDDTLSPPNYFSDHRVAVYTCIFGKYDHIYEPLCFPDNIDYYIITDLELPTTTRWKKIQLNSFENILNGMTNVEKNRWFKMHPHLVFKEYKYSIYIDGNIVPVTDFTEFINRIGYPGVAMYWHGANDCVYQEALYNKYLVRKISNRDLDKHIEYLKTEGMPKDYGMTTCNVIARDHDNKICLDLMNNWWNEFCNHCKRDQISFPYVVWQNRILMKDIAKLGNDVWNSSALLIMDHQ